MPFRDSDDLHPAANVSKMRSGIALDDADRARWLDTFADWIEAHATSGGVVTCSALKRIYSNRPREADGRLRFLFLAVDTPILRERMEARHGHFMPAELLRSQLDAVEPPGSNEPDVVALDGAAGPEANARTASEQHAVAVQP